MAESVADADFERRARLALVWQDLVTPVRAIVDYQEIAIEEGRRLGLTDELPFLEKALVAAGSLSAMVNRLRDPGRTGRCPGLGSFRLSRRQLVYTFAKKAPRAAHNHEE